MGPTWDPPGADRTQVGPMLAQWTRLSGIFTALYWCKSNKFGSQYAIRRLQDIAPSHLHLESPCLHLWHILSRQNLKYVSMVNVFSMTMYCCTNSEELMSSFGSHWWEMCTVSGVGLPVATKSLLEPKVTNICDALLGYCVTVCEP